MPFFFLSLTPSSLSIFSLSIHLAKPVLRRPLQVERVQGAHARQGFRSQGGVSRRRAHPGGGGRLHPAGEGGIGSWIERKGQCSASAVSAEELSFSSFKKLTGNNWRHGQQDEGDVPAPPEGCVVERRVSCLWFAPHLTSSPIIHSSTHRLPAPPPPWRPGSQRARNPLPASAAPPPHHPPAPASGRRIQWRARLRQRR